MAKAKSTSPVEIIAYKGFDKNMQCRGYQFEVGKTYEHAGPVKSCKSGFHACKHPLSVFEFYAPGRSRYAEVKLSGVICDRESIDTKIASAKISVEVELSISDLVKRAWDYVRGQCTLAAGNSTTGYQSASQATGYQSASQATGDQSASQATGYQSASQATGYRSASQATGYRSASQATGDESASQATGYRSASQATGNRSASQATGYRSASQAIGYRSASQATGKKSVAWAHGFECRAMAVDGSAIGLTECDEEGNIISIFASKVGENGIKPNTFYMLKDGKPVEAS